MKTSILQFINDKDNMKKGNLQCPVWNEITYLSFIRQIKTLWKKTIKDHRRLRFSRVQLAQGRGERGQLHK